MENGEKGQLGGAHAGLAGGDQAEIADETPRDRFLPKVADPVAEAAGLGVEFARKRGPGRPPGSKNLRSEQAAKELVERYGDPLEADMAIGNMPTGALITELRIMASERGLKLGMTIGDVLRLQAQCRASAYPYVHAKRAPVNEEGETVTPVMVFGGAAPAGEAAKGGRSIFEESVDYQDVTPKEGERSHGGKSHGKPSD